MRRRVRGSAGFLALALGCSAVLVTSAACVFENSTASGNRCHSTVDRNSFLTPGPGQLSVAGDFDPNESMLLKYNANAADHVVVGQVASGRATFSGLPKGDIGFVVVVSCGDGVQEQLTSGTVTIL